LGDSQTAGRTKPNHQSAAYIAIPRAVADRVVDLHRGGDQGDRAGSDDCRSRAEPDGQGHPPAAAVHTLGQSRSQMTVCVRSRIIAGMPGSGHRRESPGSRGADTRQTPAEDLQYAWDISYDLIRRWMRETLASEGIVIDELVS
jgi:hypothetical protein